MGGQTTSAWSLHSRAFIRDAISDTVLSYGIAVTMGLQ